MTEAETADYVEDLAATMLASTLGIEFDPSAAWNERKKLYEHTQLIIDVVPGRGAGFTLEAPEGVRFLTRSRVFTDAEVDALAEQGEPAHG